MSDRWTPDASVGLNAAISDVIRGEASSQRLNAKALAARCVSSKRTVERVFAVDRNVNMGDLEDFAQGLRVPFEELLDRAYARLKGGFVEPAPWYSLPAWDGQGSGDLVDDAADAGNSVAISDGEQSKSVKAKPASPTVKKPRSKKTK